MTFPLDVKPILVEWIDSMGQSGWGKHSEADLRCVTVGILIRKEADRIILAMNKSAHSHGEYMNIPLVAVRRIRKLK